MDFRYEARTTYMLTVDPFGELCIPPTKPADDDASCEELVRRTAPMSQRLPQTISIVLISSIPNLYQDRSNQTFTFKAFLRRVFLCLECASHPESLGLSCTNQLSSHPVNSIRKMAMFAYPATPQASHVFHNPSHIVEICKRPSLPRFLIRSFLSVQLSNI
jgi:hypothetical protein